MSVIQGLRTKQKDGEQRRIKRGVTKRKEEREAKVEANFSKLDFDSKQFQSFANIKVLVLISNKKGGEVFFYRTI
jgi:hypothetical protein